VEANNVPHQQKAKLDRQAQQALLLQPGSIREKKGSEYTLYIFIYLYIFNMPQLIPSLCIFGMV
jgi:hypothetical protein